MAERKTIAIVGTCPSSYMLAPWDHEDVEIWACGPDNVARLPRVNRWFEIHGDLAFPGGQPFEANYVQWLNYAANGGQFELWCSDGNEHLFAGAPHKLLPHDAMLAKHGEFFFTSTLAWMMAMAMDEGAGRILLFGVDMTTKEEYRDQRPGLQHFIHMARRANIEVLAPIESDIMQPPALYGFNLSRPFGRKAEVRRKELEEQIAEYDRAIVEAKEKRAYLAGALDDLTYFAKTWGSYADQSTPAKPSPADAGADNVVSLTKES